MKNDFQSQIDMYNKSIDSKVDGAIASYLAGIQISTKMDLDNLYSTFINNHCVDYNSVKWNSTNSKELTNQTTALLQYDLTSIVLGQIGGNNEGSFYSQNVYLVGNMVRKGDVLETNEYSSNGWNGWIFSRWLIS